jgi:hypothetical protein
MSLPNHLPSTTFPRRMLVTGAEIPAADHHASDTQFGHHNLYPQSNIKWSPSDSANQETRPLKHETPLQIAEADGTNDRDLSSAAPSKDSSLPLKECLGFSGCLSLFGGGIGALAVLIFLTFLWFGYGSEIEGRNATRLWRLIVLNDWMTRAITLTALILRVIISAQSTVCTSMIAALILEKRFTLKSNVGYLSVIRAINSGPRELIQLILSSRSSVLVLNLEFWLIMVLAILTAALQFSSTILVSDLNDFVIVGNFNHTQVPTLVSYEFGDAIYLDGTWIERPAVWSVFGEVQSQANIAPDSYGLSSTGLVQRGFIPLEGSQNRTSVRHYQGNAIVMYSKVACMQPVIDAVYSPPLQLPGSEATNNVFGRIQGFLDYGASLRSANADSGTSNTSQGLDGAYFDCNIPSVLGVDSPQSSFCLANTVGGNFWTLDLEPKWSYADDPWSTNSSMYLVYTTNMGQEDWNIVPKNQSILPGTPYGEWETYIPITDRYVNISLCFSAFDLERRYIDISTPGVPQEPTADWSALLVAIADNYNVTDIQNYISISSDLSPQDRGIFNMTILGPPNDGPPFSPANNLTTITQIDNTNITISFGSITDRLPELSIYYILSNEVAPNSTFISCFNCDSQGVDTHPNVAVLFNSIITYTQRPVQAMQSFMTNMATTILDDYQSTVGGLQDAQLATTTTVRTPGPCSQHSCAGFITVATLLCLHLLCVIAISALYVRQACYSRFGNIWHAVSQLMSDELKETLRDGGDRSDETIKKSLKLEGKDCFVKLEKSSYDGKIEVVKLESNDSYVSDEDGFDNDEPRVTRLRSRMALKNLRSN